MTFSSPRLSGVFSAIAMAGTPARARFFLLLVLLLAPALRGQEAKDQPVPDKETMKVLMQKIAELEAKVGKVDQLEARIKELEAASKPQPHVAATDALPVSPTPNLRSPEANVPQEREADPNTDRPMSERMDFSKTLLRIRGFGDITLHGDDHPGDKTSFTLGQLDLFVTSDISERFKFLSEVVFEGGPDNIYGVRSGENNVFGVDVERLLLQYSQNDYFQLAVGRYHTAIGYYNTAFHHSTWFQTTTDRPLLFEFEDRGGILPIHNVGVSASGIIPSGPLGLHYVAEVGNGRESRSPLSEEPVQNINDENSHKAFNLALFSRPEGVRGLQTGFSFYHDLLTPAGATPVGENIFAAHVVFDRSGFEWLNEALLIRHAPQATSRVFNTPGFYTQVSKQFGAFRPYFRYQYVNAANSEPIFPDVRLRAGPSLGIRYDASDFVALKLQYDYTVLRDQPGVNGLALQLGFTF
jgi:hypothetical protein